MLDNNSFKIHGINYHGAFEIFNFYGIYDNTEFFAKRGYEVKNVFVASPIKALLDILYNSIVVKGIYPAWFMLDGYIFEDVDMNVVKEKLNILGSELTSEQLELLKRWEKENGF